MNPTSSRRGYKTLPSAFRRPEESRSSRKSPSNSGSPTPYGNGGPLFGGISSLISGGMQFFGQLGRKKSNVASPPPRSSSASDKLGVSSNDGNGKDKNVATSASEAFSIIKEKFGTSSATSACLSEFIEMTSLPTNYTLMSSRPPALVEGDDAVQVGTGHVFHPVGTFNPTWCDLCRDLVWGLYDTGATRCIHCHLTCHQNCQLKIKLNCVASVNCNEVCERRSDRFLERKPLLQSFRSHSRSSSSTSSADQLDRDESTLANISTLKDEEIHASLSNHSSDEDESVFLDEDQVEISRLQHVEEESDDEYKTLRDVSAMEDFVVDDDLATSLTEVNALPVLDSKLLLTSSPEVLAQAVTAYNRLCPPGQATTVIDLDEGTSATAAACRGYIRVSLNLRRPIHVLPGTRPPSVYNLTKDLTVTTLDKNQKLTSFYLPQDTVKALHITSLTCVHDVIRALLSKFRVVDNPHKFALYDKNPSVIVGRESATLSNHTSHMLGRQSLRKMHDEEKPLLLALTRSLLEAQNSERSDLDSLDQLSCSYFVLQENDPGEICWESFSLPELKNFLRILDREEAWYKRRIHEKYELVNQTMRTLVEEKRQRHGEDGSTS